jgi:hypothetical protein
MREGPDVAGSGSPRSAAFRSNADLDLDAFRALCEQEVDPGLVPNASAIVQRVPCTTPPCSGGDGDTRGPPGDDGRLNDCLLDGPGVLRSRA